MEIGGLSDCNGCHWCHAGGGRGGGGSTGGGRRGGPGEAPVGSRGEAPAGGSGAEPPDYHEMNLKCFMHKFCHEMRQDL